MRALTEALIEAAATARAAVGRAVGTEAAHVAVSHVRSVAGESVFPSIYRLEAGRMWLVAQAGYVGVYDGISLERGVLARAARTGEVQWVPDSALDPDFVAAQPGFVSELAVPVADHVFNLEATEPFDEPAVEPLAELARFVVERARMGRSGQAGAAAITRALGQMVSLPTAEQIAEYACRLVALHLGLSTAQMVVRRDPSPPLSVLWQRDGASADPIPAEQALDLVESKRAYTTWLGGRPQDLEAWPASRHFVVVPVFRRGELAGGVVGAAPRLSPAEVETEMLAAIAAHSSACLERVALEEELTAALTARRDLVAAVSHELRTPLTAIIGYTDLLLEGAAMTPQESRQFISVVRENAHLLRRLVGDILDVARAEAGRLAVRTDQRVDLGALASELAAYLAPQARERGVKVRVDVPAGMEVRGDETRIRQVLLNLVGNAVKFSRDSQVDVVAERDEGFVAVEVRDEGEGIAAEDLPGLFRPFTGRSVRDPGAGTGLGLVISRRLAEAMGGSLTLDSPGVGLGATARLLLPAWP